MDGSVLKSKKFLVLGTAAFLVGVGTVVAIGVGPAEIKQAVSGEDTWHRDATGGDSSCDLAPPSGSRLEATVKESWDTSGGRAIRTLTYSADARGLRGGVLAVCTGVGEIDVRPGSGGSARVVITIEARGADAKEAVKATRVEALFAAASGGLGVTAQPTHVPRHGSMRIDGDPQVRLLVEVPDSGAYGLEADAGVGDVNIDDLTLSATELAVGVGDIDLSSVETTDDLSADVGVGDMELGLSSVRSGRITLEAGTGSITLEVPRASDTGYDVTAEAGVGSAEALLGDTEVYDRDDPQYGPGGSVHARTRGYAAKAQQIVVDATAGVGDVRVSAG